MCEGTETTVVGGLKQGVTLYKQCIFLLRMKVLLKASNILRGCNYLCSWLVLPFCSNVVLDCYWECVVIRDVQTVDFSIWIEYKWSMLNTNWIRKKLPQATNPKQMYKIGSPALKQASCITGQHVVKPVSRNCPPKRASPRAPRIAGRPSEQPSAIAKRVRFSDFRRPFGQLKFCRISLL